MPLKKLIILKRGIGWGFILLSSSLWSNSFDYPLVLIKAGQSTLYVPISNSYQTTYVKKEYKIPKDFYIGQYEVSNQQWTACYLDQGCSKAAQTKDQEGPQHPAVRLNWHDAFQYSQWLSKKTGQTYRLPTEEEWTYAAHMGKVHQETETSYEYSSIDVNKIPVKITRPLGSISKNQWGIYDLMGNVWEWTLSCWFSSEENILKTIPIEKLNSPQFCSVRIAVGENRAHIQDFISDTYNGGCATLRPAANLGFRLVKESH